MRSGLVRVALLVGLVGAVASGVTAADRFRAATKARIEKDYAIVVFENGTRTIVPLGSLSEDERALLTQLASDQPLAHGKSQVVVAKETVPLKKTIVTATKEGAVEKVQLCPPNVFRDQIGATCMAYARVHWLDIAGYGVDLGKLYQVINAGDPDQPWKAAAYHQAMRDMVTNNKPRPVVHALPPQELDPFAWARAELRQGRPILAAFPREIWQALPAGFVAQRPWGGGGIGHQIVINGFTWDEQAKKGTFHIINSWNELQEFELSTDAVRYDTLMIEQSLSPRGEPQQTRTKEVVTTVTLIRAIGKTNLYEVETNLGRRKIAAVSDEAARAMVENPE